MSAVERAELLDTFTGENGALYGLVRTTITLSADAAGELLATPGREQGFEDGLRAARTGVLHTETDWPQERKDGYAAGWLRGNGGGEQS